MSSPTQDSQSVVGNILEDLVNMEMPARFHNTDWAEYAIEAYVTTRVKEAERLARIDELERFTSEPRRSADSFHQDVYVIKTARLDQRIQALTTTANGKEVYERDIQDRRREA